MKYVEFTDEEKVRMFDKLSERFYNSNFGQISKSDIELLMFHFYIQKMIDDNMEEDGTINYSKCSDYRISQDLGITQQRVRSLKIRNQLTHHIEFDWKKAFAKLTQYARYDERTGMISVNIPDPCLLIEIQNFLDESGAYIEKTLNSKVLRVRAEYYIDLAIELEPEESRKSIIKKLRKEFDRYTKENSAFNERNIGKSLIEAGVSAAEIISSLSTLACSNQTVMGALIQLLH